MTYPVGTRVKLLASAPWHGKNGNEVILRQGEMGTIKSFEIIPSNKYTINMDSGEEVHCVERMMTAYFEIVGAGASGPSMIAMPLCLRSWYDQVKRFQQDEYRERIGYYEPWRPRGFGKWAPK